MKKMVRAVIIENGWVDGSGWSYSTLYDNSVIEVDLPGDTEGEPDWGFLDDLKPLPEGEDIKWEVKWYELDDEELERSFATWETWQSEIK